MKRPDLAAIAVAALFGLCLTVCALLHVAAPPVLETLATIALSAGVGIAVGPSITTPPAPAPAPAPAAPAVRESVPLGPAVHS